MSIGGGKSKSSTTSTTASETQDYGTNIWGGQSPYLSDLYARANSASNYYGTDANTQYFYGNASNQNSASDSLLQSANSQLGNMGMDYNQMYRALSGMDSDLGQASNALGMSNNGLGSGQAALDQSRQALSNFLNPGNADPLAAAYQRQMGQAFREEFMPELQGNAALAGGLGGSRQQIGAALGSQRSMQAISDFNTGLYGQQMDRALAAAQGIGALSQGYQQNAAGYGQQANAYGNIAQLRGQQSQGYGDVAQMRAAQAAGLQNSAAGYQGASQNSLGLAQFGQSLPWYNLNQYAGLLGVPIMQDLGSWGSSTGTSRGGSSGGNFSFGLG